MRHQFFVLFASILLILVVLTAVVMVGMAGSSLMVERNWQSHVFEEFIAEMQGIIDFINAGRAQDTAEEENVMSLILDKSTERISGCILRDERGKYVVSLGMTPMGVTVPTPRKTISPELQIYSDSTARLAANFQDRVLYLEREVDGPDYELTLVSSPDGGMRTARLEKLENTGSTMVYLPEIVKNQDIAGTLKITVDGVTKGYLDILVYRMNAYRPTAFIYKQLIISLCCFALPAALLVSVFMAYMLSKRTGKRISEIQKALEAIAAGDYSVKVPRQNVFEYDKIAKSVNKLARELQRHQRARKEWIRNISHDLNTPVTSLSLMVGAAADGIFPVDEKLLRQMKAETDLLTSRIASVNYYSQLLYPETMLVKGEQSLQDVMDEVLQGSKLQCLVPGSDMTVYADRGMLDKALLEVIKNANDYGDRSETPSLVCYEKGGCSVLEVRNKGSLPKPLPQFFEPWARGDSSRATGGSGLGLSIVAEIMELHQGTVTIDEEDGHVIVRLSFPVKGAEEEA